jgi:Tannase and feruloyl esterase
MIKKLALTTILLGFTLFCFPLYAQPICKTESFPQLPDLTLTSATLESAPALHCKISGVVGSEIHFELLLPEAWNGKFVFGGGGGFAGGITNWAQDIHGALQKGYATVGTDTGHQAQSQDASWALNNLERLENFGHQAVHRTTVNAKALIKAYYGRDIARNYFVGCSRGGGQALMETQRYPDDFEGIVAQAPAFNWTHELGARWLRNAQLMYPDPTKIDKPVIDSTALKLIGDAVMNQCDALDGIKDGILNDPRQCDFDVSSLACGQATSSNCLSQEQVNVAKAIYGDFEVDGQVIHGTPFGAELPGTPIGWELWHTGGYKPGEVLDFHEGADSGAYPEPVAPNGAWAFSTGIFKYFLYNDADWSYAGYDFKDFAEKATRVAYTLNADNPDLSAFRARGGKLIMDNGWMDGSMSAYNTIKYYDSVMAHDSTAQKDVRLFIRPGVAHCVFGPGPDVTDYLTAIDEWVETGIAPEQLVAQFRGKDLQPIKEGRILCAYPKVAKYDGKGDTRDVSSFGCVNKN